MHTMTLLDVLDKIAWVRQGKILDILIRCARKRVLYAGERAMQIREFLLAVSMNGKLVESPENICDVWATHFGFLATPMKNENYDDELKKRCFYDSMNWQKLNLF